MKKLRLFVENFFIYGIGGVISKIIPLIMVPIITRLMPDSAYIGINDMSVTLINFSTQICTLGLYDAMYRLFFENEDEEFKRNTCSTTLTITFASSLIAAVLLIIFRHPISEWFFKDRKLSYLVFIAAISTVVSGTNSIVAAPTRMQNQRIRFIVMNTIGPILSYSISIPLIIRGYYIVALPIAAAISGLIKEVTFWLFNKKWFQIGVVDKDLLKQLLRIGIPLLPNFLIYWVFNYSDKIMITNILDMSQTGLYSVGSKLGLASQLIYSAFAGGWQFFAFSTMKEKNQIESNSLIYEYLGVISFCCGMIICVLSYPIYKLLFVGQYVNTFIIAPYLFLAPLLQMLFQVGGNQFLIIKKTGPNALFLSVGALANVVLNLLLIPQFGIEGAAIATLIGYVVSDVVGAITLCKLRLMAIHFRFLVATLITIVFFATWRIFFMKILSVGLVVAFTFIIVLLLLYRNDLFAVINLNRKGNK